MTREEFEHALRAAVDIVDDDLVVVGSQAILAQFPVAPPELLVSLEVDVFPLNQPERSDEIDGAIGDGSQFSETFGLLRPWRGTGDSARACRLGEQTDSARTSSARTYEGGKRSLSGGA